MRLPGKSSLSFLPKGLRKNIKKVRTLGGIIPEKIAFPFGELDDPETPDLPTLPTLPKRDDPAVAAKRKEAAVAARRRGGRATTRLSPGLGDPAANVERPKLTRLGG